MCRDNDKLPTNRVTCGMGGRIQEISPNSQRKEQKNHANEGSILPVNTCLQADCMYSQASVLCGQKVKFKLSTP